MTGDEELRIISCVTGGDKNAYEQLVLENQNNVYNLALKLTGNKDDALDISQEAFLKAYTGLGSFRGDSRFSVWLYRLTYNLCIDMMRRRPKANIVSMTQSLDGGELEDMEFPDLRELPDEALSRKELRETITVSIDELGEAHREILLMREVTGMSYSDISQTLGIGEGTVKSRLARARQNLANILIKKGTFPKTQRLKERKGAEADE